MRRSIQNSLWLRTLLVFAAIFVVYTAFILIPRIRLHAKQQLPTKALAEFRAAINQNYLSYQQLVNQTSKDASTSINLAAAQQSLAISQQAFQHAIAHPPKQIKKDTDLIQDLKQADKLQSKLLALYSGRYNALLKPLQYIPADDLNTKQASINRALLASKALQQFATDQPIALKNPEQDNIPSSSLAIQDNSGSFRLSVKTRVALQASASCFTTLAQQLKSKSSSAASTLRTCNKQYETTRQQVTAAILTPLRGSDGKALQANLLKALQQIDKKI